MFLTAFIFFGKCRIFPTSCYKFFIFTRDKNADFRIKIPYTYDNRTKTQLEIDFVANRNDNTYYIQSALTVADPDKQIQETRSLNRISDSFKKIVVVRDDIIPSYDDKGIYYIGIEEFLLHYIDTME